VRWGITVRRTHFYIIQFTTCFGSDVPSTRMLSLSLHTHTHTHTHTHIYIYIYIYIYKLKLSVNKCNESLKMWVTDKFEDYPYKSWFLALFFCFWPRLWSYFLVILCCFCFPCEEFASNNLLVSLDGPECRSKRHVLNHGRPLWETSRSKPPKRK
jgi:hypothetical protein